MMRSQNSRSFPKGLERLGRLLPVVILLAACGFHPIYGSRDNSAPVEAALNDVMIDNIGDRYGQMLRNNLIDRMYHNGRPQQPRYHLNVALHETSEGIGLLPNATTSLTELNLYADYTLRDIAGKEIFHGTAHAVATYNQLQEEYGTLAASENAHQRCINEVSDQIVERVSLYFSEGTAISSPQLTIPEPVPRATP